MSYKVNFDLQVELIEDFQRPAACESPSAVIAPRVTEVWQCESGAKLAELMQPIPAAPMDVEAASHGDHLAGAGKKVRHRHRRRH